MEILRKVFYLTISCLLIFCCFVINSKTTYGYSNSNVNSEEKVIQRSIESLRDIDYQTWQIVVYPSLKGPNNFILRIIGYPGSLRIDHPTNLIVNSGRKHWELKDITKIKKAQFETLNASAAEFDLSPLIAELNKNKPLRLSLPGLINDLTIPPYLVREWRSLDE